MELPCLRFILVLKQLAGDTAGDRSLERVKVDLLVDLGTVIPVGVATEQLFKLSLKRMRTGYDALVGRQSKSAPIRQ